MGAKDQHCEESSTDITHTALLDFVRLFVFCFFALKTLDNASGLFEFKSKSNQIRFLSSIARGVVAPSPELGSCIKRSSIRVVVFSSGSEFRK